MTNEYTYGNEEVHENTHVKTEINSVGDIEIVVIKKDGNKMVFNIQDTNEMGNGAPTIRIFADRSYVRVLSAFQVRVLSAFQGKVFTYE